MECFEMIRRSVINISLRIFVIQINLLPNRRLSIPDFFEDCLHVMRYSMKLDTGQGNGKCKVEEKIIVRRIVTVLEKTRGDGARELIFYRFGEVGYV